MLLTLIASVLAVSYQDCRNTFESDKKHCQRFGSAGDRHGACVTAASKKFDTCIALVDQENSHNRMDMDIAKSVIARTLPSRWATMIKANHF